MRKQMIYVVLMMLLACEMRSQDTTDIRPVTFPFWMAKEIALDLAEKEKLEGLMEVTELQLLNYGALVDGLEGRISCWGCSWNWNEGRPGL